MPNDGAIAGFGSPSAVTRGRSSPRSFICAHTAHDELPHPLHANGFRFRRAERFFVLVAAGFMNPNCFKRTPATFCLALLFFFGLFFKIRESAHELGSLSCFLERRSFAEDPVAHLGELKSDLLCEGQQQRYCWILTRISGSFGGVVRDLIQTGNWIRVMSVMESFQRPSRSVPTTDLIIASRSTGVRVVLR
jgi:hypothetical protein